MPRSGVGRETPPSRPAVSGWAPYQDGDFFRAAVWFESRVDGPWSRAFVSRFGVCWCRVSSAVRNMSERSKIPSGRRGCLSVASCVPTRGREFANEMYVYLRVVSVCRCVHEHIVSSTATPIHTRCIHPRKVVHGCSAGLRKKAQSIICLMNTLNPTIL